MAIAANLPSLHVLRRPVVPLTHFNQPSGQFSQDVMLLQVFQSDAVQCPGPCHPSSAGGLQAGPRDSWGVR